jgi:hypothetical protein
MRREIDADEVVRLYRAGRTLREVAAALGCSVKVVQGRLAGAGALAGHDDGGGPDGPAAARSDREGPLIARPRGAIRRAFDVPGL